MYDLLSMSRVTNGFMLEFSMTHHARMAYFDAHKEQPRTPMRCVAKTFTEMQSLIRLYMNIE